EFSGVVQAKTDAEGGEVTSEQIWHIFQDEYLPPTNRSSESRSRYELLSYTSSDRLDGRITLDGRMRVGAEVRRIGGSGTSKAAALVDGLRTLGIELTLADTQDQPLDGTCAAYVSCRVGETTRWGVGVAADAESARLQAVVSASNRLHRAIAQPRVLADQAVR
ncbi:MAG: alpha-isopropylmalate synthase regulatory domain-containing protein, partial [Pseudolysinimonas sp.]